MKTTWILSVVIAGGLIGTPLLAGDRPANRQKRQQTRIAQGVRSGELTRPEAKRIQRSKAKLHREIVRDRVDGGGLTPLERRKIEAKQDALSTRIARQKHDRQAR